MMISLAFKQGCHFGTQHNGVFMWVLDEEHKHSWRSLNLVLEEFAEHLGFLEWWTQVLELPGDTATQQLRHLLDSRLLRQMTNKFCKYLKRS